MSRIERVYHWLFRKLLHYKICPACGEKLDLSMSDREWQDRWMRHRA